MQERDAEPSDELFHSEYSIPGSGPGCGGEVVWQPERDRRSSSKAIVFIGHINSHSITPSITDGSSRVPAALVSTTFPRVCGSISTARSVSP
jgi:hypothetical protein